MDAEAREGGLKQATPTPPGRREEPGRGRAGRGRGRGRVPDTLLLDPKPALHSCSSSSQASTQAKHKTSFRKGRAGPAPSPAGPAPSPAGPAPKRGWGGAPSSGACCHGKPSCPHAPGAGALVAVCVLLATVPIATACVWPRFFPEPRLLHKVGAKVGDSSIGRVTGWLHCISQGAAPDNGTYASGTAGGKRGTHVCVGGGDTGSLRGRQARASALSGASPVPRAAWLWEAGPSHTSAVLSHVHGAETPVPSGAGAEAAARPPSEAPPVPAPGLPVGAAATLQRARCSGLLPLAPGTGTPQRRAAPVP